MYGAVREFGKGIRRGGSLDERGDVVASYSLCASYRERHLFVAADGCLAVPNILPRSPLHHFVPAVPTLPLSLGSEHSYFNSDTVPAGQSVSFRQPRRKYLSRQP